MSPGASQIFHPVFSAKKKQKSKRDKKKNMIFGVVNTNQGVLVVLFTRGLLQEPFIFLGRQHMNHKMRMFCAQMWAPGSSFPVPLTAARRHVGGGMRADARSTAWRWARTWHCRLRRWASPGAAPSAPEPTWTEGIADPPKKTWNWGGG